MVGNYPSHISYFTELDNKKETRIIRSLTKLRMTLFLNFVNIENQLKLGKTISEINAFNERDVLQLERWGVNVVHFNYRANDHMKDFNAFIADRIDNCKELFPSWVEWAYIRNLFIMPNGHDESAIKAEYTKYIKNKLNYPFTIYILN